jgi:hypothetical protein
MHRTKKMTVATTGVALLMAAGMSSAMATSNGNGNGNEKVTICHRTGSDTNPYVTITISKSALPAHHNHPDINGRGDIFPPDVPATGCPGGPITPPGEDQNGDDCIASSGSGDSTQSQHGLVNVGNINLGLNNLLGNGFCHSNVGNGLAIAGIGHALGGYVGSDSGDGDCFVESLSGNSSQEQEGLVNVGNLNLGLNNPLGNGFCQSNVLNGLAIAGIGDALAGDVGSDSGDGDCIASSLSGDSDQDQDGAVNVGNINVGGNNLLANAFCQSDVLNGLAVSLIGPAYGASSLGSGLLGGPAGILSGGPGFLLSGLTTDVQVLANVLVQF